MKNKYECKICGKKVGANNSYVGSHVKRVHKLSLLEYFLNYENEFKNLNPNFKIEKCAFCNNNAEYSYDIDYENKTFRFYYNGYMCGTKECKNKISLKYLGKPYDHSFEHIGSRVDFLAKKYNKSEEEIRYSKGKGFRESNWTVTLENFIKKYGEQEGRRRYNERSKKISKALSKDWFIEKYGKQEGIKKFYEFKNKMELKNKRQLGYSVSKKSKEIKEFLKNNNIKFEEEKTYKNEKGNIGYIDFYLPNYNVIIEFYGDYWHCNPNIYDKNYFHKSVKKFAKDIWNDDEKRINHIFENAFQKNITVLIIWEGTKFSNEYLYKLLNEIKDKKTIIEL